MGIDEENCNKILEMFNKSIEEKDREIADIKFDENGKLTGIKEQLDNLKGNKDTEYLFNKQEFKGTVPADSYENIPNVEDMNYTQLCAYMEKNGSL